LSLFGNSGKSGQLAIENNPTASEFKNREEKLDVLLHELVSYDPGNPFENHPQTTERILEHLDQCKILDPACGSGAFPMGILQKMVHILQKLDPQNKRWKNIQRKKAERELKEALSIEDKKERKEKLLEISNAFDEKMNDPDYARKLYLIENCIYGVDIQPVATQISKLRFFISLVVDQKSKSGQAEFWHPGLAQPGDQICNGQYPDWRRKTISSNLPFQHRSHQRTGSAVEAGPQKTILGPDQKNQNEVPA
jgi:hypothetical protein